MKAADICQDAQHFTLFPQNNQQLARLCGYLNEHIKAIENHLHVIIRQRGYEFEVVGDERAAQVACATVKQLYSQAENQSLTPYHVHMTLQEVQFPACSQKAVNIKSSMGNISGKNVSQHHYLSGIEQHDVTFGIGPAGTGKTFLAVACAMQALMTEQVSRIILVRPAVEAGEHLGFLPGDFSQKIEPYLRPLYDALHDLAGPQWLQKQMEKGTIEIVPLAFMRGRTLNDSFIIMDEAQNTTVAQMKMFLTRLGFGSKAVITGDVTQIDLPARTQSGLCHAMNILHGADEISFTFFKSQDAVRHRLVQKIIDAYEACEQ